MDDAGRTLAAVQVATGTYELREVVTPEVRDARREGGYLANEREPLTWEELLSLPASQRAKWSGGTA